MTQLNPPVLPPNKTSPAERPLKPYRSRRIQPASEHSDQPPQREQQQRRNDEDNDDGFQHIDVEV